MVTRTQGAYGNIASQIPVIPPPIIAKTNPATSQFYYPIGQNWYNQTTQTMYQFLGTTLLNGQAEAVWSQIASATGGDLNELIGDSGTAIASGGAITLNGTSHQIITTFSGSTGVFSIPTTFIAPGSITATSGAITATNGNLVLGTAGNKIVSTSVASTTTAGANSFGTVALVAGTATVSTTAVTASSIIMLTRLVAAGTSGTGAIGMISVGTIVANTSFVINALTTADLATLVTNDISTIGWMIIN